MLRTVCFVLAGLVLAPAAALAQDGAIEGRVLDAAGLPLPGAYIEIVGVLLATGPAAVTDRVGRYRIDGLAPGAYTLHFTLPGFRSVVREGVEVGREDAAVVDVELAVGIDDDVVVTLSDAAPDWRLAPDGNPAPDGSPALDWGTTPDAGAALRCAFHDDGSVDGCRPTGVRARVWPAAGAAGAARLR